ncbi:alanine aminotransferase 2-like [Pygocentrus nattereri]|uniref:alanine aminotransferase 2-like n=1 Tax=Pygocentrus nattereri TaxID=42514 RepID=UPI0008148D73|nr:alanine aminotransferase 2-like [Pygocentrus nattereri]XP_017540852.1 alanine aminotransferase 2-like [Pygocentrus nattereri]XP_017540853.1 alanine aminotransferase 2-like [Pygocentrus nattereri]
MPLLSEISSYVRSIQESEHNFINRRAEEINSEPEQDVVKHYKVLNVSSGDAHAMGLKPLTFVRQVLAACIYPSLLLDDSLPHDVRKRAQCLLEECGSIGSYAPMTGIRKVLLSVSEFITRRDGIVSNPDNIIITSGSQHGIIVLLKLLVQSEGSVRTGVLIPVPCYISFKKALTAQGAVAVPYYLCEEEGWTVQIKELRRALHAARGHCNPMVLYIINPGNPSGHVQSKASIEEVIRFAAEERLFLMADEVYQSIVYGNGREFYSYKKVLSEMGSPYSNNVELASFHTISKGAIGECGLRTGYMELVNIDPEVMQYAYSLFTINLNVPVIGQIALDVMADPPQPGQPSYALYAQQVQSFQRTLMNNVQRTLEVLTGLPGITCQPIMGGVFAFARLHLSEAAIKHAKEKKLKPDFLYCLRLLEDMRLFASPGCDFGQEEGTYHIRMCLATPEETMEDVLQRLKSFHLRFIKEFP